MRFNVDVQSIVEPFARDDIGGFEDFPKRTFMTKVSKNHVETLSSFIACLFYYQPCMLYTHMKNVAHLHELYFCINGCLKKA